MLLLQISRNTSMEFDTNKNLYDLCGCCGVAIVARWDLVFGMQTPRGRDPCRKEDFPNLVLLSLSSLSSGS